MILDRIPIAAKEDSCHRLTDGICACYRGLRLSGGRVNSADTYPAMIVWEIRARLDYTPLVNTSHFTYLNFSTAFSIRGQIGSAATAAEIKQQPIGFVWNHRFSLQPFF